MPSLTVLFWNVDEKPLATRVARLAASHAVDVVALAECRFAAGEFGRATAAVGLPFAQWSPQNRRLRVWSRAGMGLMPLRDASSRQAFAVFPGTPDEIVLVATHLVSKLRRTPDDQALAVKALVRDIESVESDRSHRRTVVVGDLNMNPFERGVVGADNLHAVMWGDKVREETRGLFGETYRMFYNPMWGFLGDRSAGPPGTYYSGPRGVVSYFWEMFDQVLVRPELIDPLKRVEILTHDGADSLVTGYGIPDRRAGSDHLPILFRLEL